MDWHLLIGIAAGLIQTAATIPYLQSILRSDTKPNVVSWSLWTFVVLITLAAQITAGASWSLFLLIGSTLGNLAVIFLCLRGYGYKRFGNAEGITLVLALVAITAWWLTSNPVVAIVLAIAADALAYIPTLVKVFHEPTSEARSYWAILVVADLLALVSVMKITPANILFPISYAILNAMVLGAAFLGQRQRAH